MSTAVSTYTGNGWRLVVEMDQIEVTSNSPRPDPEWRYTDAAGHEHHYGWDHERGGFPTLVWQWDDEDWTEDPEEATGRWECKLCREVITPAFTGPSMFREFIRGMTHVRIDLPDGRSVPVTPEEWKAIQADGVGRATVQAIVDRESRG